MTVFWMRYVHYECIFIHIQGERGKKGEEGKNGSPGLKVMCIMSKVSDSLLFLMLLLLLIWSLPPKFRANVDSKDKAEIQG